MVNAVGHRDYLEEGAQVTVEIFDDRVEIYNPCGLAKGLKPEEFGTRSVCRNPLIASLLLRCNYIEKLGTGIERIRSALKAAVCADVNVRFNTMFTLEFARSTYVGAVKDKKEVVTNATSEKMSEKTPEKTRGKTSEEILRLAAANKTITIAELSKIIGVSTRTIERNIEKFASPGQTYPYRP